MDNIISLLFAIIVLVIIFRLRKEISKIVNWIVSFQKITKNEKGFSFEGFSESNIDSISNSVEIIKLDAQTENKNEQENNKENNNENDDYFSLYLEKKYDESLNILNRLIDKTKDVNESIKLKSQKGLVLFSINREGAIQHFQELINLNQNNNRPYYWYAASYYWSDIYDKCLEIADKGINSVNKKSGLISLKVDCLKSMGDNEKAKETLIEAINLGYDSPNHFITLCDLLKNEPENAYKWFQEGLKRYNENTNILSKFADFLKEHDKNDEALLHYQKLVKINPESSYCYGVLGNSFLKNNFTDKALISYKKANELANEKEGWIIANIGNIYNNQGFYTEAISYLKKSLEIEPDSEYSHDRLAKALKSKTEEDKNESEILLEARKKNQFN